MMMPRDSPTGEDRATSTSVHDLSIGFSHLTDLNSPICSPRLTLTRPDIPILSGLYVYLDSVANQA